MKDAPVFILAREHNYSGYLHEFSILQCGGFHVVCP